MTLGQWKDEHLKRMRARGAATGKPKPSTIQREGYSLEIFVQYAGPNKRVSAVTKSLVQGFVRHRRARGRSEQTILNDVHSVSSMCTYARAEGLLAENPVPDVKLLENIVQNEQEATVLEHDEVCRLVDECYRFDMKPGGRLGQRCPYFGPVVATFVLSGLRKQEGFGLEVRDIDFTDGIIHVRPNVWRDLKGGLKSRHAIRKVPLWPQAREALGRYLAQWRPDSDGLLFPNHRHRVQTVYKDLSQALVNAARRAGEDVFVKFTEHRNKWHCLRHSYASHRLFTQEGGVAVSTWTVARELGHRDEELVRRRYSHALDQRNRIKEWPNEVRFQRAVELDFPGVVNE